MDEYEVRAKAAEISAVYASRLTSALFTSGNIEFSDLELSPLALAPEIEEYIRTGKLPDAIQVTKKTVK